MVVLQKDQSYSSSAKFGLDGKYVFGVSEANPTNTEGGHGLPTAWCNSEMCLLSRSITIKGFQEENITTNPVALVVAVTEKTISLPLCSFILVTGSTRTCFLTVRHNTCNSNNFL